MGPMGRMRHRSHRSHPSPPASRKPMPRLLPAILLALALSRTATADEPLTLDVWPGAVPGEKGDIGEEKLMEQKPGDKPIQRLANVSKPTITVYRPTKDKDTGAAVLICPGGGYNILAMDLEGSEVATWLNSIGVTGVVLKYRVPRRANLPKHLAPLQD